MSRFFARHRLCEFAATMLVVFLAVSVTDIDDYDTHMSALRAPVNGSTLANGASDIVQAASETDSSPDHACCCLLCVVTLADSIGPRVLPPSAGKLSQPLPASSAGSAHVLEVFHPPSA